MRIYCPEARLDAEIKPTAEQRRHMKVLRLTPKDKIYVFDGHGNEFLCEYSEKVSGKLKCIEKMANSCDKLGISIAISVAKGSRMDTFIEKATEIGVDEIIPVVFERTIVKPGKGKLDRWRNITIGACEQSGRNRLPKIFETISFEELMGKVRDYDKAVVCNADGGKYKDTKGTVIAIIGPEGGFTDEELKMMNDYDKVKLSPNTLRIETAGITAVAEIVGKRMN